MADNFLVATGSKKISNLAVIDSISGSAVIPVVMSNVVGSSYPITNGTTNQISYQDFRQSVIEENANIFTAAQTIQIGSGNSQQTTTLTGVEFTMITGSGIADVTTNAEGLKLQVFGQGASAGAKFYSFDNTEATPASRFKTFMEVDTGNGNLNLTRNVITTGNLNVAGNLGLGGNLTINQNLVVGGTITAQSYNTEFISASVIYESGSTKFGDTFEDTHEFTGSVNVSGSISLNTLTQNRIALVGANGTLTDNSNLTYNGTTFAIGATTVNTNAYVNINSNGLKVDGTINNPLIGAVTSSLINIVGGLQAYSQSLKSAAIVSSSQQIQNYNLFAVTSSGNTFYGNQQITGSLSIAGGQFNVLTGSGQLTSSLTFTHNITAPNDGNATLELRHNNDLYNDDIAIKLKADFAGAYIDYEEDGTPYSVLSVQSFVNKNVYLHRDTRLFGAGLTVDNSLIVKQNAQITGSLIVSGGLTGSILATNGVVSSSNQLFELNVQTGSQNSINLGISIVTASLNAYTASGVTSTSNINNFTSSQIGVNNGIAAVTASLNAFTSSQIGVNTDIAAVTASLNSFTASQLAVNNLTQVVTSSLITDVSGLQLYTASLNVFTSSAKLDIAGLQSYTASLKAAAIVSSSTQISNYYKFAETASASTTFYGNITSSANIQANKLVFTDAVVNENAGGQKMIGTSGNILYLYTGTSGLYINNQANNAQNVTITDAGVVTTRGGLTIGGAGNDQNLTFGGTNSSIYWGAGGPARMYYNVGDIKISSNGSSDVLTIQNIGGILVSGGITGSLMATNGVVSSSQQIQNYNTFAVTSSANTFYGDQTISGSLKVTAPIRTNIITGGLDVNGGITGSFKGNLAGVADYASTVVTVATGTTTDTSLFPVFTSFPNANQYVSFLSHASSSFFYNGVTRRLHMEGFVVSGSNNIAEISGSLNVSGSTVQIGDNTLTGNTVLSGSINVSGSTTFNGNHTLSGTNTIIGNTEMSGSINVSGSSNFHNSIFIVTGSSFFTGSHEIRGNSIFSGSINIASGSSYYRAGNKLFNYGQWASLERQSGSADTAYAIKLGTQMDGREGIYVANNGSGFPTRITVENTGLYNIQFSLQLNTTATETCDFSVWMSMTGSNVANSNTDFSIDKTAGGGNGVAALNFLTPITANDYVELYFSKTTANGELVYKAPQSTPTRPATPSAIVTVTQVA